MIFTGWKPSNPKHRIHSVADWWAEGRYHLSWPLPLISYKKKGNLTYEMWFNFIPRRLSTMHCTALDITRTQGFFLPHQMHTTMRDCSWLQAFLAEFHLRLGAILELYTNRFVISFLFVMWSLLLYYDSNSPDNGNAVKYARQSVDQLKYNQTHNIQVNCFIPIFWIDSSINSRSFPCSDAFPFVCMANVTSELPLWRHGGLHVTSENLRTPVNTF